MSHIYKIAPHVLFWLGPDYRAMAKVAFKLSVIWMRYFRMSKSMRSIVSTIPSICMMDLKNCGFSNELTNMPWLNVVQVISFPSNLNLCGSLFRLYSSSPVLGLHKRSEPERPQSSSGGPRKSTGTFYTGFASNSQTATIYEPKHKNMF